MEDYEFESRMLDTPDGVVYVSDTAELRDVMTKYISAEFGEFVTSLINDCESERVYAEERAQTDADAIAEENDYLRSQLLEVQNVVDSLANEIEEKQRLNKQDFYLKLVALSRTINTVL